MGVKGHGVFQTTDNPRDVTVWHDFETLDAAKAFAESSRLQEVMKQAGVAGEPTVVEHRRYDASGRLVDPTDPTVDFELA